MTAATGMVLFLLSLTRAARGFRPARRTRLAFARLVLLCLWPAAAHAQVVMAPGTGSDPVVRILNPDGTEASFVAYGLECRGGVRVALGDVNGDGIADIITGAGPSAGPHVRVFSGTDLSELASFFAYDPLFTGGIFVAAGDVNGDGRADIITGAGAGGGPHVKVFSGADLSELASFFAYSPLHLGGVYVAAGDVNGDGHADIITGAGAGGGPHVRVFSGTNLAELAGFYAYDPIFAGGVSVASLDANGDGLADIVTGAGRTGGPHVKVFSGADLSSLASFFAYDPIFAGGVLVAAADFDGDGQPEIVTGAGASGGPHVRVFRPSDLAELASFYAFDPSFTGGVFVASLPGAAGVRITSANATTFTVGVPGTFTITTVGAVPPVTISVNGTLPAGVTFTDHGDGTATLAGTPAVGTGGSYGLTFTVTSGTPITADITASGTANVQQTFTQSFTLTVNEAPAITSAAATNFTTGAAGTFQVTTRGFPRPAITRGGAALPAGVTWIDNGNGTGTLAGTPAAGSGGTYALTFTAADNGVGPAVTQTFMLTVSGAPAFTSGTSTTFTVGSPGSFPVTTVGTPTPAITVGALPAGVTFVSNPDGTGTLSGTPAAGTGGVHTLTFTAANGVLPNATQTFTLTINQAPAITSPANVTFTVGTPGSFPVTTSGFPVPSIAPGGVALPSGVTFTDNGNGTGTLAGTPAAGTGGTYAISFTASNVVGASAPQAFTLTVNQAPAFTSAAATAFTVGVAGTFSITTSGFPAITTITQGGTLPSGVTFTNNGNGTGTLAGTPAAGTGGTYPLTFTINNGVGANVVQSFTLTVNQPPAITSANSATFTVGTPGTFTVTTTGFPVPTVSKSGTLPTGVTFTPATKILAGTATQTGTFPNVFTATNGIVPDATQNFTLTVVCPAITVTPLVMPDGLYQTVYAGVDFNQTGSTGTTFTWGATGLPAGLTIDVNTGVVSGTATNTVLAGGVTVTVTDNFGCQGTLNTSVTVRPTTDNESYINGVGNTQFVVGVAGVTTPNVSVSDNVKIGDNGPGALSITFPATSPNGSIAEGTTDGTFIYTPNVGFGGSSDSFTYTLTDGNGVTNTATVTISLSGLVWYVNSSGGNGDGRSHNPFNTLASASTASASGSTIYVHTGGATTPGNLTMDANQSLFGQGATFNLNGPTGLTIPGGTRPTLSGLITLANNTTVTALNVAAPTGFSATLVTGPIAIDQVNITGGANALSLDNVTGTVTVTNTIITNATGADVLINGGNSTVSIAATITSNSGRIIDIQNRTGGTVTFTGAITDTGTGILLNNNGASTFSFSGGLTLNGAGTTFTATNASLAGTLTITGTNTIGAATPPTSGTALNVTNVNIGASGLTFRSISANGAANGILLNTTGSAGGLTVTGDGSTGAGGLLNRNASGGTIQNTTDDCVRLTSAQSVTLRQIDLLSCGNTVATLAVDAAGTGGEHAVEVSGGSNVVLSAITIDNPASTGILILNGGGTNRVNNNSLITHIDGRNAGGLGHGLYVFNNNVNMTLFDFRNNRITNNVAPNATFFVANGGTANMQADVRDSLFDDLSNQALTMAAGGVVTTTGTLTSNIINNDFLNAKGVNENNLGVLVNNGATHVSLVQDNLFDNIAKDGTIANTSILRTQNSGGVLNATVTANTIQNIAYGVGAGGRHAIGHVFEPVAFNAADSSTLIISNNTISNITYTATNREAIFIDYRPTASGGKVTIQGNTIDMPTAGTQQAIELRFRQTNPSTVPVLVRGNTVTHNTAVNFLDVDAEDGANVQLTVDGGNNFTNTNATPGQTIAVASEDPVAAGGPSTMCVNITGNTLQSGGGTIEVNEAAGTLTVTQASAAALATANGIPGGNVTVLGGVAFGGSACIMP